MKRRVVIAALGCFLLGSVMLSACSSPVSQTVIPEVIQVQNVDNQDNRISLVSSETVEVVPDMAKLQVTVRTENSDAMVCQQENTKKLNQLLEYLKGEGYEDESIETSGFSLNPRYDWSDNTQKLVGYDMRTTVTVTDIPMEKIGAMLTAVVENGANEIDSVSYFSSQYDQAYNQALAKAIELSKGKGEALAAASGMKLGQVLKIQEQSDTQYGRYVSANVTASKNLAMAAAGEAMAMDVMPGEMQVTAEITVEFELLPME
jgi:uncharacterized protein YggE